jgi:hypothetical protein
MVQKALFVSIPHVGTEVCMSNALTFNQIEKTSLTETEQVEAQKHEKIVEEGLAGYVAIGEALGTIRDQHLFVGPFRNYVGERFEIDYPTANRRIVAARVALNLKAAGLPIPANQDQAYQLHDLTSENQVKTWQKVLEQAKQKGVRITTNLILNLLKKKPQPRTAKKETSQSQAPSDVSAPKFEPLTPASNEKLEVPVTPAVDPVEKAMLAPNLEPEVASSVQKHDNPVAIATQSVGKALSALQTAFGILEGGEIVAHEELDAKLSEITALVTGIRGLLPAKKAEPLKLVG